MRDDGGFQSDDGRVRGEGRGDFRGEAEGGLKETRKRTGR